MGTKTMKSAATSRNVAFVIGAALALFTASKTASAQEVVVTGPLAGAPAAHKLRLYREGRFEFQPNVTFSLLDEYQRNISDSFALGVWGTFGALKLDTALSDHVQTQITGRACTGDTQTESLDCRLTSVNLGQKFSRLQRRSIHAVAGPKMTVLGVLFRPPL